MGRNFLNARMDPVIGLGQRVLPRFAFVLFLRDGFNLGLGLLLRFKQELREVTQQVGEQGQIVFKFVQHPLHGLLNAGV